MIATNYSTLRSNMKAIFDKCNNDAETIIVTRKNNNNIVVMSEEAYNNLLENLYLRQSKANYNHILKGIQEAENGKLIAKELLEDE